MPEEKVREVPMLFDGESVRGLLGGYKSMSRRPMTHRNSLVNGYRWSKERWATLDFSDAWVDPGPSPAGNAGPYLHVCDDREQETWQRVYPRLWIGDRLWCKETFAHVGEPHQPVAFRAGGAWGAFSGEREFYHHGWVLGAADPHLHGNWVGLEKFGGVWKPSIFLPRRFARLVLEVVRVFPERVNEISAGDCVREGVGADMGGDPCGVADEVKERFRARWNAIHGRGAWGRGEFVWAYELRRVTG